MYLQIKNPGICDIESFYTFGISTSRGNENLIGQFGSGAKHGILTLLRMGINPIIYSGKNRIQFWSAPAKLSGGQSYSKVFVQVNNEEKKELSVALEYGALDWDNIDMALREFISNAIDASNGKEENMSVKIITDKVEYAEDYTTIAIPVTTEVQRFYNEIYTRFLCFDDDYDATKIILEKAQPSQCLIYRKGVFVRTLDNTKPSLYNYNFGNDIKIDESRNMSDWECQHHAAEVISKSKNALRKIFRTLNTNDEYFETKIGGDFILEHNAKYYHSTVWKDAWIEEFGEDAVAIHYANNNVCDKVLSKGYVPIYISNPAWFHCILAAGISSAATISSEVNDKGDEIIPATFETMTTFNKVWEKLSQLKLTRKKEEPTLKCFVPFMDAGCTTRCGYVKDNTIYISKDHDTNVNVMLEEVSHYITGFTDESRELQAYAFQIAGELIKNHDNNI